jgi:hypothetical protein
MCWADQCIHHHQMAIRLFLKCLPFYCMHLCTYAFTSNSHCCEIINVASCNTLPLCFMIVLSRSHTRIVSDRLFANFRQACKAVVNSSVGSVLVTCVSNARGRIAVRIQPLLCAVCRPTHTAKTRFSNLSPPPPPPCLLAFLQSQ